MAPPNPPLLSRRRWLTGAAGFGAAAALGTGVYAWRVEPHWVRVVSRPMPLRGLPRSLAGKRLVQLSDLHVGPVVDNAYLRRALRRVAGLRPDMLAITGDFMTSEGAEQIDATLDTLTELPLSDTPVVAALGNHDYGHDYRQKPVADTLQSGLEGLGVRVLRNSSCLIDRLRIAGCGDLWSGECRIYESLREVRPDEPAVMLAHNPDTVDLGGWGDFRGWILSGHTHGGQCRLPLLGPPILPVRNHRYSAGHIRLRGGRRLYVNRGLGYKRRVRLGVRPEVTVFRLVEADV